jgi:hypothetical protein
MTFAVAAPAFAQTTSSNTNTPASGWQRGSGTHARMPGVFGTVSAISGTTITITGKTPPVRSTTGAAPTPGTAVTYTVDASNATVTKGSTASTVSAIVVGDTIMVQGTVTGTNVVATTIRDGVMPGGARGMGMGKGAGAGTASAGTARTPIIQGNGEPVIAGTVSSESGSTLTIGTKSNITYSVDATNATITKAGATSTISSVATGDSVVVQGTVNGTSVVASSVIDQGVPPTSTGTTGTGQAQHGFFGALGGIFGGFLHMFGF